MTLFFIRIIGILVLQKICFISSEHDTLKMISQNKPTDMSSANFEISHGMYRNPSDNGVDGSKTSFFETESAVNSWFLINLLDVYSISYIIMFNRHDSKGERLAKVNISIGIDTWRNIKQCGYFPGPGETGGIYNITCVGTGKFVFLQQNVDEFFHLSEVEVYGTELENPIIPVPCLDIRYDEESYYEGTLSTAINGAKCTDFNITHPKVAYHDFATIFKNSYDSYKNYCRNPDRELYHWCFTAKNTRKPCNLRRCTHKHEDYSQLLSYMKPTGIRPEHSDFPSNNAVDGLYANFVFSDGTSRTSWKVYLIFLCKIKFILLFNSFKWKGTELKQIEISISLDNNDYNKCATFDGPGITHKMYNITCKGDGKWLELKQMLNTYFVISEVEVYGNIIESSLSITYKKPTKMSSKFNDKNSEYGVDGDINTFFQTLDEPINWWRVDLIDFYQIRFVRMSMWTNCCAAERIRNVTISIGLFKDSIQRCNFFGGPGVTNQVYSRVCKGLGRIVQLTQPLVSFSLSEVNVFGEKLVDGNWSDWTCPSVCENANGDCNKTRTCTNPKQLHGGEKCTGISILKELCPIHGSWSNWICPSVCESVKVGCNKTRTCTNPKPKHQGNDCRGLNISHEICPIDGSWTEWTCPKVCESGKVGCPKTRTCTNPKPQHKGNDCRGKNISKEICSKTDGQWSEWTSCKSVCSPEVVECSKQRNCTNPTPRYGGNDCEGNNTMSEKCPKINTAANNSSRYAKIALALAFIMFIIVVCWSIYDDKKKKQMEEKEYELAIAGVYGNEVNPDNPNPQK